MNWRRQADPRVRGIAAFQLYQLAASRLKGVRVKADPLAIDCTIGHADDPIRRSIGIEAHNIAREHAIAHEAAPRDGRLRPFVGMSAACLRIGARSRRARPQSLARIIRWWASAASICANSSSWRAGRPKARGSLMAALSLLFLLHVALEIYRPPSRSEE